MAKIIPFFSEYDEYLRDESRSVGFAESISFPKSTEEVQEIMKHCFLNSIKVTVQGARTGLAAAAVPGGGHIMNLKTMDRALSMRCENGFFFITVQAGMLLLNLRKALETANFDFDDASSLEALGKMEAGTYFFAPDPTETSASIGGMAACNASGARSYRYGSAREHINALRIVLANGDTLYIRRGDFTACGRRLSLTTEQGHEIVLDLPTYTMPDSKNASGYYIKDDMDAVDLFVGSDGTLGVICELELKLLPTPAVDWGVNCMFESNDDALDFVEKLRECIPDLASVEYFDKNALNILRTQKENNPAFSSLPTVPERISTIISLELHCSGIETAYEQLFSVGELMDNCGGNENDTFVARTQQDLSLLQFFRHAIPESVNMLIDQRKRTDPTITKLGSDMSVPNRHLRDVVSLYLSTLSEGGFEYATWGHIGANHLHVNILPRNAEDYARGKKLYASWAEKVSAMGGAVSAEHGVGKLKRDFLTIMYGQEHIDEMAALKYALDSKGLLGSGNLFAAKEGKI